MQIHMMSILLSIFQLQKLMNKTVKVENLFLRRKDKKHQKNNGCKFIRINTSDARRGYDKDYEVIKMQIFISKFKDEKIKEIEKESSKLKKEKKRKNKRTRR